ncbi:TRAP transporter small permease [Ensifer sp. NM-2]|uniref:TRAP transporter small permease n=1 Tax=Ensifer sp. NM-2 TaxID=2109730 RepID=UPI000D1391C7|nr:TRAP transporter small permease [Ensifer sp. NM-2]PSS64576.1 TRAP transporter small permease [Ensifer sp. NM-2]
MRLLERVLTVICVCLMAGIVIVPTTQVVLRNVFTLPFIGAEELTRFLLICLVFVSYPLVVQNGENIVMGEIKAALPKKLRGIINVCISITAVAIGLFLAWVTVTNISKNLLNATPTLGIPFWIFLGATFFGFAGAAVVHLLHLRKPPQADTNIAV